MPRHHLDHPPAGDPLHHLGLRPRAEDAGARVARFLGLDRAEGPHAAARLLHARRPSGTAEARLRPFLRLLRGRPS